MQKFAKTFHNFVQEAKLFNNVDGTGGSDLGVAVLNWVELMEFDKSILEKVIHWFQKYNIAATAQYYQETGGDLQC